MDKQAKGGHPPKWWTNVIKDIERAVNAGRRTFKEPGIVIGFSENDKAERYGVLVRMRNGDVGYYSGKEEVLPPMGSRLKGDLPSPESIIKEPAFESFVFEVIREKVKLIPRIWLRRIIKKMVEGKPITMEEDLKPFPEWVLLPGSRRKDKSLIDLLYRATRYEGLKGLERYNDKADI